MADKNGGARMQEDGNQRHQVCRVPCPRLSMHPAHRGGAPTWPEFRSSWGSLRIRSGGQAKASYGMAPRTLGCIAGTGLELGEGPAVPSRSRPQFRPIVLATLNNSSPRARALTGTSAKPVRLAIANNVPPLAPYRWRPKSVTLDISDVDVR